MQPSTLTALQTRVTYSSGSSGKVRCCSLSVALVVATLPQQFTLSLSAADLLTGSSFDNATSLVGMECSITNRQYLLLLHVCPALVR